MPTGIAPEIHSNIYPAIEPGKFVGSLIDKVALVTGAGRGIGKAIALAFARAGADVALLARTKSELDNVAEEIKLNYNKHALVFPLDVTDNQKVIVAFEETERRFGKINIVVANAGSGAWRPFVYSDFDADVWKTLEVNLKAPLLLMQLAAKSMREGGKGTIIAISSNGGIGRYFGLTAYCASKAALNCSIGNLQLELDTEGKAEIQAFAVHPGVVDTKILEGYYKYEGDMERVKPGSTKEWGEFLQNSYIPSDLCAQTCVYLATGAASELRGRYIDVQNDIESLVEQADVVKKENLYDMGIRVLGA